MARRAGEHECARVLDRAAYEESEIPSIVDEAADELHPFGAIRGSERIEEGRGLLPVRRAEEIVDLLQRDGAIGEGDDHIQHAFGISERALRLPCDGIEGRRIGLELLLLDDLPKLRDDSFVRDAAQVEALRARADGRRDLLRL